MKPATPYRLFWIISFFAIALLSSAGSKYLVPPAAAQGEPTSVPTATVAPTWTPVPGVTSTPTPVPGQTPTPTGTPTGRDVDLRPSSDDIEIEEAGDCVLFTWLVKGDIDRVEWDEEDDDLDPILVDASDERTECVDEETAFVLIVRWLNGQSSKEKREIKIVGPKDSGDSSGGGGPVPTPGAFVVVTPLLITNSIAFSPITPTPVFGGSSTGDQQKPEGILGTIVELPETGSLNAARDPRLPHASLDTTATPAGPSTVTGILGGLMAGLGGLIVLVKLLRQSA